MCRHKENLIPLYASVSRNTAGGFDGNAALVRDTNEGVTARMIFSASRIGTWIACNRKAGWEYFAGYRSPSTPATEKGTQVHAVLEAAVPALVAGNACEIDLTNEIGAIAAEIVPHIPAEAICADTQFEDQFTVQGRHTWTGYIDLRAPGIVIDYKTTSDFKYMKTESDLLTDPQAVLYARSEFIAHPELETVWQRWIYSRTRGAKQARMVELHATKGATAALFDVLETFADEMQAAADACPPETDPVAVHKYVLTLHGNEDRCGDYGGCPHRDRCGIFFTDPNKPKDTHHMSPLERLQAMTALNGGPENTLAPLPPPPAPTLREVVDGHRTLTLVPPPNPFMTAVKTAVAPALLQAGSPPTNLFARLAAEAGIPAPGGNSYDAGARSDIPGDPPQAAIDAEVAADARINPPKRGRGRPKKDTVPAPAMALVAQEAPVAQAVQLDPGVAAVTAPTPAPSPLNGPSMSEAIAAAITAGTPAPRPVVASAPQISPIGTLYVGCMPVARNYATLDSILLQAREMIGPAAYFGGYGYKTNGMMSEAVSKILASRRIESLVVEDPRLPEAALVLSYLRANAAETVEALR
jgi:hypothetical protein